MTGLELALLVLCGAGYVFVSVLYNFSHPEPPKWMVFLTGPGMYVFLMLLITYCILSPRLDNSELVVTLKGDSDDD